MGPNSIHTARNAANGLLANLVGYWALDEAGGANNALDKHTNGLTLTQSGSPGSAAGLVYAGVRTFAPASTQSFSRNSEAALQTGNIDFTVAAWVWLAAQDSNFRIIAAKGSNTASSVEWGIGKDNANAPYAIVFNGSTSLGMATWGSAIQATQWYLVTMWHVASESRIYLSVNDGNAVYADLTGDVTTSTYGFSIANYVGGNLYWSGRIGPVAFWKSAAGGGGALSATKRTALYNAGAGFAYAAFTA